jgi:hypothetical protein
MVVATAFVLVAGLGGCGPKKSETLRCKDGTFVSGTGAREVCAKHGGVKKVLK